MMVKVVLFALALVLPAADAVPYRGNIFIKQSAFSEKRCYKQAKVTDKHIHTGGKPDSLSIARQLETVNNHGDVVHYEKETYTSGFIPRSEVVASVEDALNGDNNFEVEYRATSTNNTNFLAVQDLTRNDMLVSEGDDLSGVFSVMNAFVRDDPDVVFRVDCPAAKSHNTDRCHVTQLDAEGNVLVNCMQEESLASKDTIPDICLDKVYNVNLMALQNNNPHFFLFAERQDVNAGNNQDGCPPNVGMDSSLYKKRLSIYFKSDLKDVPGHKLGSATLGSIIQAEENAEPLSPDTYDVATENCLHYTFRISRSLDFKETDGLAQFIFSNVSNKDGFVKELKKKHLDLGGGGIIALEVFKKGGKEALNRHISDLIYSQLEIKV